MRADHVNPALTPNLTALATQGVTFQNALTVSPLTLPAHASLFTGLHPMRHGVRDNAFFILSEHVPRYPTYFQAQGYATAAFVSSIVLDRQFGMATGFDHYDDQFAPPERHSRETLERAWQWVRTAPAPFFLWIHLFDPHSPYQGSYAEEVKSVDRHLGVFFRQIQELGLWEDLIVAVTSDHGEALGEHGEKTHGFFIYDSTLRIPLILKAPGLPAAAFPHQVSIVDVLPTIHQLLRNSLSSLPEAGFEIDGTGLLAEIRSGRDPGRDAYGETFLPSHQFNWSKLRSIRGGGWKLIEAPRPELFDLARDPGELHNLWTDHNEVGKKLEQRLVSLLESKEDVRTAAEPNLTTERFMSLGYIGSAPPDESAGGGKLPADPKTKLETYLLVMDALELSETGKPLEALTKIEAAEKEDPDVTQIQFLKGSILGGLGRFPEAIQALLRTVALNPRYVTGRFKLAQAYLAVGQLEEAERTLRVAVQQDANNFRAYHNLAVIAVRRGDLYAAESLERQALAINPDYYEAWNTLGAIQISRQQPGPARESLQRALKIEPAGAQAFYNLSLAETALGNEGAAAQAAQKACQLDAKYCRR